ncbi:MAG TPA: DUF3592 domain-containing protein [Terriglobales bacterium]|nr:DUF3592 domain-containing protein [Terriglobales bacterium]
MNDLRTYQLIFAAAAVIGTLLIYFALRKRKTPEQLERERRERLSQVGRITDGTVVDAQELDGQGKAGPFQLLIYHYDVAGVSYEASQDITHLRQFVDIHTCRIGLPTSVRYDPQNPGNSIVISENWIGLRAR